MFNTNKSNGKTIVQRISAMAPEFTTPEYLVGFFIQTEQKNQEIVLNLSIKQLLDKLKIDEEYVDTDIQNFQQLKQQINNSTLLIKNNLTQVQVQKLQLTDLLILMDRFQVSVTININQISLVIPKTDTQNEANTQSQEMNSQASYSIPQMNTQQNSQQNSSEFIRNKCQELRDTTKFFRYLMQQQQYYKPFNIYQLISDLYLSPLIFKQQMDATGIQIKSTNDDQQIFNHLETAFQMKSYSYDQISLIIEQLSSQVSFQDIFNLQKVNKQQHTYLVIPPYNIQNLNDLKEKLQIYTLKKQQLQQFMSQTEYLNDYLVNYVINQLDIPESIIDKKFDKFELLYYDQVQKDLFLQLKKQFKFSEEDKKKSKSKSKQCNFFEQFRDKYSNQQFFQQGGSSLEKNEDIIKNQKSNSAEEWLNTHLLNKQNKWYEDRARKAQTQKKTNK